MSETYEPTGFAREIFGSRHAAYAEEPWADACKRVAWHVAAAESGENRVRYFEEFRAALLQNRLMPGGRIWYGSGRARGQLLNCFVIPTSDSREGWGKTLSDTVVIAGTGGGIGTNYSPIRPRGAPIKGTGGFATGAVSLMLAVNNVGDVMGAGGGRRIALMQCLSLQHPDIVEFLDKKLDLGQLNNANVSVVFDEDPERFFELVRSGHDFPLTFQGKQVGSIPALELWDRIVRNMLKGGEPGILNMHLANQMSNVWYLEKLVSTNPCITGDTLIATADGRNAVSISTLCIEGRDVPVYSTNTETGQVEIKMARNPRVTGRNVEVWRLTLDDGTELHATPNHKILRKDLTYCELKDLKQGESIFPFNSFDSNRYRQVCGTGITMKGGGRRNRRQYRLIHEFVFGSVDASQFAIHHIDFNSKNDSIGNLLAMPHSEHRDLHAIKMMGAENPYHLMDDEWKQRFASHSGELNGRCIDISNEELLDDGRILFKENGKLTPSIWRDHAKRNGLPQTLANKARFGTWTSFYNQVIGNHKVDSVGFYGYEDVYNITVDDNHNYHVITSSEDDRYITSSGICVKNCGEIGMTPYESCVLGHVVLPRFVIPHTPDDIAEFGSDPATWVDWEELGRTIRTGVRFLDDVLTVNTYPLSEIEEKTSRFRRLGLGIMGLHHMLIELGLRYNSIEGLEFSDKLGRFLKNESYEASIDLAIERGSFTDFDAEKVLKSKFVKGLRPSIRERIRKHGLRNCALNTIAPTGTISIVAGVSSGIESIFAMAYERRYRSGDEIRMEVVADPLFKRYVSEGRSTEDFQNAYDLSIRDHLEMQRVWQKHVDNAISKTISLPPGTTVDELSELLMEFVPELKGMTVYPVGSRENQPLTPLSREQAEDAVFGSISQAAGNDACRSGACDV